jgi:hypothetical protein
MGHDELMLARVSSTFSKQVLVNALNIHGAADQETNKFPVRSELDTGYSNLGKTAFPLEVFFFSLNCSAGGTL